MEKKKKTRKEAEVTNAWRKQEKEYWDRYAKERKSFPSWPVSRKNRGYRGKRITDQVIHSQSPKLNVIDLL